MDERDKYIKALEAELDKALKLEVLANDPNWDILRTFLIGQVARIAEDMTSGKFKGAHEEYVFAAGQSSAYRSLLRYVQVPDTQRVEEMKQKLKEAKHE